MPVGLSRRDDRPDHAEPWSAACSALGALGTGIAYVLNYRIVAAAGPTTASTVTYLTPLVAILVGVAFLGETLSWNEPIGGLIVVFGVAVSQGRLAGPVRRLLDRQRPGAVGPAEPALALASAPTPAPALELASAPTPAPAPAQPAEATPALERI